MLFFNTEKRLLLYNHFPFLHWVTGWDGERWKSWVNSKCSLVSTPWNAQARWQDCWVNFSVILWAPKLVFPLNSRSSVELTAQIIVLSFTSLTWSLCSAGEVSSEAPPGQLFFTKHGVWASPLNPETWRPPVHYLLRPSEFFISFQEANSIKSPFSLFWCLALTSGLATFSENGPKRGQSAGDSRGHPGEAAAGPGQIPPLQGALNPEAPEAWRLLPIPVFPKRCWGAGEMDSGEASDCLGWELQRPNQPAGASEMGAQMSLLRICTKIGTELWPWETEWQGECRPDIRKDWLTILESP